MKARFHHQQFEFKRPSGTSRGILTHKDSWFITLEKDGISGVGECSIIPGLSPDFAEIGSYEAKIQSVLHDIEQGKLTDINAADQLAEWPSILFGVEIAFLDLKNGGKQCYFDNAFSRGEQRIPINGLIWMGDEGFMAEQIEQKLEAGFTTIKMKVGAIDFDTEHALLRTIRKRYSAERITLRVDANGAFQPADAMYYLERLSELDLHSIEQPIKAGQWDTMAALCADSPLAIALDEELIGIHQTNRRKALLETIRPPFIILKPSLHGGISGCREWISLCEALHIDWWMTSALESNTGLNAICQFVGEYNNPLPQGLGTGGLYTSNTPSQLEVRNGFIQLT